MTVDLDPWRPVRRRASPIRAMLGHQLRERDGVALVGRCHDGSWASTHLQLGTTTRVTKLTLGMALSRHISELFEVNLSAQSLRFTSVFETDSEGAIIEGEFVISWRVNDPVRLINAPEFDHIEAIQRAAEDKLRPFVARCTVDDIEALAGRVEVALEPMQPLRDGPVSWGKARSRFRLTGIGALHQHAVESIRRARVVDEERRGMEQERINFYTDVINSGQISLYAMMLSNDKNNVAEVLSGIRANEITVGRATLRDDPYQQAIGTIMNEADEFDLQEMRKSILDTWNRRQRADSVDRLRDAIDDRLGGNGSG